MRKTLAVAKRVIAQFRHDKRTLALMFVAPVVVLWLLSVLLGANEYEPTIAVVDLPQGYVDTLKETDATIVESDMATAKTLIADQEADAILSMKKDATTVDVYLEGGNNTHNAAVQMVVVDATHDYVKSCKAARDRACTPSCV